MAIYWKMLSELRAKNIFLMTYIWGLYHVIHCRGFLQIGCRRLPSGSSPLRPPLQEATTRTRAQLPKTQHCQFGANEPLQMANKWPGPWQRLRKVPHVRITHKSNYLINWTLKIVNWRQRCPGDSPHVSLSSETPHCSHLHLSCRRKTIKPFECESSFLSSVTGSSSIYLGRARER